MLVLASASPRRADFLSQLGYSFTQQPANIDETPLEREAPQDYVVRMAEEKAQAVSQDHSDNWVLGSDTAVVAEQSILGKPRDYGHFRQMMSLLSKGPHQVLTAIALCRYQQMESRLVTTQVWMTPLTDEECRWYWNTGEPLDKAGGYGIQGLAGRFIPKIEGSYSAVVGLPLYETSQLLRKHSLYER